MDRRRVNGLRRREFLEAALSVGAAGLLWGSPGQAAGAKPQLLAGEGVVDITPPLGIEMGGFHRKPGSERRIKTIRQPTAVRALVLAMGDTQITLFLLPDPPETNFQPSFLQGHSGDVNPGDGSTWRGEINQTTAAITPALDRAVAEAKHVYVDCLRARSRPFHVPLDMGLFQQWRDLYRKDPSKCVGEPWVDSGFAADWFRGNADRDVKDTYLPITLAQSNWVRSDCCSIRPSCTAITAWRSAAIRRSATRWSWVMPTA